MTTPVTLADIPVQLKQGSQPAGPPVKPVTVATAKARGTRHTNAVKAAGRRMGSK